MRFLQDGCPVYTATDLCDYLACGHLVALKRRVAAGESIPSDRSALSEVLANLGAGHEQRHLDALRARGLRVKAFDDERDRYASSADELRALEAETVAAMGEGYDVIYQPTFFDGRWMGRADFLLKVRAPSARGAWSYEAADAKLARRVRSEAVLQLCEYSAHLERLQGSAPVLMQVVLGDGTEHAYRVDEFSAYHATVKSDFESGMLVEADTYPDPVDHCNTCGFAARCAAQRKRDDHLSQVARMRSGQVLALQSVGINTMTGLAVSSADAEPPGRMSLVCARCQVPPPATSSSTWRAMVSRAMSRSSISSVRSTCTASTEPGGVTMTLENAARSRDLSTTRWRSSSDIPTCTSTTTRRTKRRRCDG
jgi:uncharacterized protein